MAEFFAWMERHIQDSGGFSRSETPDFCIAAFPEVIHFDRVTCGSSKWRRTGEPVSLRRKLLGGRSFFFSEGVPLFPMNRKDFRPRRLRKKK